MQLDQPFERTAPSKKRSGFFSWAIVLCMGLILWTVAVGRRLEEIKQSDMPALELRVIASPSEAGENVPLLTQGRRGEADILYLKIAGDGTARVGYDHWGSPEKTLSNPFPFPLGRPVRFTIDMPSLNSHWLPHPGAVSRLKIDVEGSTVLDESVACHPTRENETRLGANPIGATSCKPTFEARFQDAYGRDISELREPGLVRKMLLWRTLHPRHAVGLGLSSLALAWVLFAAFARFGRRRRELRSLRETVAKPHVRVFSACFLFCLGLFYLVLTGGTGRLFYTESFGSFYDNQMESFIEGRLDVPEPCLSGESFVVDGKVYGYFGPTPALMRLPFVLLNVGFEQLSRPFLLFDYAAILVLSWALFLRIYRLWKGPSQAPSRLGAALFVLNVGIGSTLFFLGSRAYVYHEAIACGVLFALASAYAILRHIEEPGKRRWLPALICAVLSVHARPSVGLFALSLVGFASLWLLLRALFPSDKPWRAKLPGLARHIGIGALSVLGAFSFNVLSYAKFKTFDGAPLRYHVQYDAARLARFEGKNFHLSNMPLNFSAYFLTPNYAFTEHFPWLKVYRMPHKTFKGAKVDVAEEIVSIPWLMPGLVFLSLIGMVALFLASTPLRLFAATALGALLILSGALLTATAHSLRYTGDFCPFLIALSALGLAFLDCLPRLWRRMVSLSAVLFTTLSIVATLALTLLYQGEMVWDVQPEIRQNYQHLKTAADRAVDSLLK